MSHFLRKFIVFASLLAFLLSAMLVFFGGNIDFFYNKFTSDRYGSMILGDSRAMQGIQPQILDGHIRKDIASAKMFNFAFTIAQTAYGPLYLDSLKRKLDTNTAEASIFVLAVSPWVLSNRNPTELLESDADFEGMPPHNMSNMSASPNFEYFIKNFHYFHFRSIIRRNNMMHKNGWLEENNLPKDQATFESWKSGQITLMENWKKDWVPSEYRLRWLENTVLWLSARGKVVLVRTPIDGEVVDLETSYWPEFDSKMNSLAVKMNVPYFNYSENPNWSTYDGHHLDKYGGKEFSRNLAESINRYYAGQAL